MLGEIGKTSYELLQLDWEEELIIRKTSIDKQLQVINDILVNYFGHGIDGKKGPSLGMINIIQCQHCRLKEHIASTCHRFTNLRQRCAKCGGGHKTNNCILKCSFCLSMGHTKNRHWKKNGKGPSAFANFLEMLVNDEEITCVLIELNQLCGVKHNFFWN